MDTKNYSLEKHLEAICKEDIDYNLLLSAWRLNKDSLNGALKTIALNFPNYSMHDISHSITLLDNIQRLLGRDRVERLGATDTFLILMAALTHDIGMYMSYEFLEKEWKKPEMEDLLKEYAKHSDKKIADAARKLLGHRSCQDDAANGFQWALELRDAVTTIIAHQMRGGHEDRSKSYLEKKDDKFAKMANSFHCDAFPSRFLSLLADVAHLHGTNFDEVLKLNHKADGLRGDMVHPRFIACMIRLGDLLDVDSNRFNPFSLATLKDLPESSEAHYDKHNAVKHLLISPDGIEAELDCPTDASYRIARELFDMLQKEVEKQSQNWNRIAPQDLGGLPPVLNQDKIIINFKGSKTKSELRNLRFDISGKRTFEMLKGGAIYQNPGRAFIREIVQNALDATKLQIWKDMDNYLFLCNKERRSRFGEDVEDLKTVEDIKFPSDVAPEVYKEYPIRLTVKYNDEKQKVVVVCEDWGTGISEESLIRMTSQVGASRKADKDYSETIKQMPYFLQPTAAFGLGLQTVFYVTNEFTVLTCCPGKSPCKIVFRSSVDGSYCSLEDGEEVVFERFIEGTKKEKPVAHGTTVTIEIGKEHFEELFEITKDRVEELEKDSSGFSYYIAEKIDSYVNACLSGNIDVPILYTSPFQTKRLGIDETQENMRLIKDGIVFPNKENYRVYRYGEEGKPHFIIEEKKYGSILDVYFAESDRIGRGLKLRGVNLTRDLGGALGFIHGIWLVSFSHPYISWDLYNIDAEQFVTISRDALLPKGYEWCKNTINELMPDIIRLIYDEMYHECKNCVDEKIKQKLLRQYFNMCIENWKIQVIEDVDYTLLDGQKMKKDCCYKINGNELKESELFNTDKLVVIGDRYSLHQDNTFELLEKVKHMFNDMILVKDKEIIPDCFICNVVYVDKNKNGDIEKLYRLEKQKSTLYQMVEINGASNSICEYYKKSLSLGALYGFKEFGKIVVGKNAPLLGYEKPFHSNCWIYPYRPLTEADEKLGLNELRDKLKGEHIKDLVPHYIVELIKKYNVLNNKLTDEEIYDEYRRLILGCQFGFEKEEKDKVKEEKDTMEKKPKKEPKKNEEKKRSLRKGGTLKKEEKKKS